MLGRIMRNFDVARTFVQYFAGKVKLIQSKVIQPWLPELTYTRMLAKIFLSVDTFALRKKLQSWIFLSQDFI